MLWMFGGAWTHASTDVLPVSTSVVLRLPLCRQMLNREGDGGISAHNVFELLQRTSVRLGVCRFVLTSVCVSPCPGTGQLPTWTDSPADNICKRWYRVYGLKGGGLMGCGLTKQEVMQTHANHVIHTSPVHHHELSGPLSPLGQLSQERSAQWQ